jgi:hypothetical protein
MNTYYKSIIRTFHHRLQIKNNTLFLGPMVILYVLFSLFYSFSTSAQIPSWTPPKGKFLSDSVKVGLPVQYALSYRHKATADIFFPDSSYNFTPFELVKREYFNTITDENGSLDSVVYTLISFEVSPVQELSLPVYVLSKRDCTRVFAPMDFVILNSIIKPDVSIDTLSLKKDTRLIPIARQVNFPLIFLVIIGLLLMVGMVFWFFGKPIRRQIKLFNFKRRYDDFRKLFQRLSRGTDDAKKRLENIEKAVVLWKKYIERIEDKPFTTFTTKEILDNLKDNRLSDALREIDATVYGGVYSSKTIASLQILQELAEGLYRERRLELGLSS